MSRQQSKRTHATGTCVHVADDDFGELSRTAKRTGSIQVGGLALSQMLTLYTTPVVYIYLDRLRLWFYSRRHPDLVPALQH